jgi:HK97 family phage prohead protease
VKRFYIGKIEQLSDDEVAGICISAGVKRDGDAWEPSGVDLSAYRQNPVVLRDHNPMLVIGTAASIGLSVAGDCIGIRIQFAATGVSAAADEARGLAKAGLLKGISAGIDPLDCEPLRNGSRGVRVLTSELLEVSLVSVPADQDALITARSFSLWLGSQAMLRSLPTVSAAARQRVLDAMARPTQGRHSPFDRDACINGRRQQFNTAWALGQGNDVERAARLNNERHADEVRAQREDESRRIRNMRGRSSG